ncbi:MAG: hypothetical protein JF592_12225 [Microbacterium sp.]|uniref:hypothetical protein n=1 Tax=Microbacterium sp. TaxID=51671 RepID=UPI001D450EE2|nr:hypothetical protein [Microbacterium sp.]MBW8763335.1 hypothetical protein [Microbacterium sp.]
MDTANMWNSALDALPRESELKTVDQRIAYANVIALLSISQEINGFVLGESPFAEELIEVLASRGQKRQP